MQQIEQGIYCENSYLGVTLGALVFLHGTIMIDAPLRGEDARSWRSVLGNYRGGSSRLLVSLDSHPDRALGARAIECTLVSHKETAQVFRGRPTIFKGQGSESGAIWETYGEAIGMRWVIPDITFTKEISLHWGEPEIILLHQPGPTPGSIWVIVPEKKVVFVGDTVVPGQPGFLEHANLEDWLASTDLLLKSYSDYMVVSGRGGLIEKGDIKEQRNFLKKVVRGMERLANRNASPDASESLVSRMLSDYKSDLENRAMYEHRLRNGLRECYLNNYYSAEVEDEDSGSP